MPARPSGPGFDFGPVPVTPGDREPVIGLFANVIARDPAYAPAVTQGDVSVYDWFDRKKTEWAYMLYQQGRPVGHIAARQHRTVPGGFILPPTRTWEMCRLTTEPDCRRLGVASALITLAEETFGHTLWATCHQGSASHLLLSLRGWKLVGPASWDDDPAPGVALVYGG